MTTDCIKMNLIPKIKQSTSKDTNEGRVRAVTTYSNLS